MVGLAVETRVDEQGKLRPGICVWLHSGGKLIKAAPEQLRAATSRERAIEELQAPLKSHGPFRALLHIQKKKYHDISSEVPTNDQWAEAPTHPTGSIRYQRKRPAESTATSN